MIGVSVYVLIILSLWVLNIVKLNRLSDEIKKLAVERAELEKRLPLTQPVAQPVQQDTGQEIANAIKATPDWSSILSEVSLVVPKDMWLTSIDIKNRAAAFKGFSTNQAGIATFITQLDSSPFFYDVEIVFSQKGAKDISFELKAKLK